MPYGGRTATVSSSHQCLNPRRQQQQQHSNWAQHHQGYVTVGQGPTTNHNSSTYNNGIGANHGRAKVGIHHDGANYKNHPHNINHHQIQGPHYINPHTNTSKPHHHRPPHTNFHPKNPKKPSVTPPVPDNANVEKLRQDRALKIQSTDYIDTLAQAPRSDPNVHVGKIAEIISKWTATNDNVLTVGFTIENSSNCNRLNGGTSSNTAAMYSAGDLAKIQAHVMIQRRSLIHEDFQKFFKDMAVSLDIENYYERLKTYFNCSPECFTISFIYIDRLIKTHKDSLLLVSPNVHRICLTALLLATKWHDDDVHANSYYAKIGGIARQELDSLEVAMLKLMEYRLFVKPGEYKDYMRSIERKYHN